MLCCAICGQLSSIAACTGASVHPDSMTLQSTMSQKAMRRRVDMRVRLATSVFIVSATSACQEAGLRARPSARSRHSEARSCATAPRLAVCLHRRTGHRAVRTEHAAIARLGPQESVAGLALIEPLAGVRRHAFGFAVPAVRTSEDGVQNHIAHLATPTIVDG